LTLEALVDTPTLDRVAMCKLAIDVETQQFTAHHCRDH
jgi:hypothetical protein